MAEIPQHWASSSSFSSTFSSRFFPTRAASLSRIRSLSLSISASLSVSHSHPICAVNDEEAGPRQGEKGEGKKEKRKKRRKEKKNIEKMAEFNSTILHKKKNYIEKIHYYTASSLNLA
jgi:hypothetical protein